MADPDGLFEEMTGAKLPAGFRLRIVEDTASLVHIVLPAPVSAALDDATLERVAGGFAGAAGFVIPFCRAGLGISPSRHVFNLHGPSYPGG